MPSPWTVRIVGRTKVVLGDHPSGGQPSRKVIAFRDFLVDHFAKVRLG